MDDIGLDEPYSVSSSLDDDGTATITLAGDIDIAAAEPLRATIADAVGAGASRFVFEMSGVDFMDSSGIGALLDSRRIHSPVQLLAPSPEVRRLIELTGLSSVIEVTEK